MRIAPSLAACCALMAAALPFTTSLRSAENSGRARDRLIGREVAVPVHLSDDDEFHLPLAALLVHGKKIFCANWTEQEGGGRPLMKGTGKAVSDPSRPLTGSRTFNRISAPDANSCAGCHNAPYGIPGGGGDFVTSVFVLGQRFDFVTFDRNDTVATAGSVDESSQPVTLQTAANLRSSPGMFGSGYIEMLAREITHDLQTIRDSIRLGESKRLLSKGIDFGVLSRHQDGTWDVSKVEGLPRASVVTSSSIDPPTLIVRPWHQAGNVVSLREFANTAFNHHHGIQSTERFGLETDLDGDGFMNELTRADVTAVTLFQAVMAVPGRVIPRDPQIEEAVLAGEQTFLKIGCASCHIPTLPLSKQGWIYTEPNPYNPPTNLRPGQARALGVDLTSDALPLPRLRPAPDDPNVIHVPAFTDLKLHDITDPADLTAPEALDMNQPVWSAKFRQGNRRFLTRRLWGTSNEPPYFHHGLFTTLRQAVLAHHGEALKSRRSFQGLTSDEQDDVIEFLKTLQVLPPGTSHLIVDEHFNSRQWPPETVTMNRLGKWR